MVPSRTMEDFSLRTELYVTIDELIADNSILEIERHSHEPLKFAFHEFRLRNVSGDQEMAFQAKFTNPVPPGEIRTSGHFEPWRSDLGQITCQENMPFRMRTCGVTANLGKTTIIVEGSIAEQAGAHGKLASLDFQCNEGRIRDLLLLFIKAERAPMHGVIGFRAKVSIPPGKRPFLKKVKLQGQFGVDAGKFTKAKTQATVERLSKGSLDEK
jgi:hypothetical protein